MFIKDDGSVEYIEELLKQAQAGDKEAIEALRTLIQWTASESSAEIVIEITQTLIAIRKRDG